MSYCHKLHQPWQCILGCASHWEKGFTSPKSEAALSASQLKGFQKVLLEASSQKLGLQWPNWQLSPGLCGLETREDWPCPIWGRVLRRDPRFNLHVYFLPRKSNTENKQMAEYNLIRFSVWGSFDVATVLMTQILFLNIWLLLNQESFRISLFIYPRLSI
jgi:hypothetical protein